ncbi:hypothetical protein [Streptomyces syringium]|uniref:hypothetical protein n=1 Tax=Streptomyces syringium TaxID=76729 RepID=UPI003454B10B
MSESAAVQQGSHFFIITLHSGTYEATRSGTYSPDPGVSGQDAYEAIYNAVTANDPRMHGAVVLFYSLTSNRLPRPEGA